jgi:polyketide biosynthesis 3-hydroxy-3-methylglutaryl-CoA synthase-like enzyme PksG
MTVGIEALNVYGGSAYIDVGMLCDHRGLERARIENLMMREKTMALPNEDPVSFAVTAAKPLIDALDAATRARIEMVITCTESGIDFGKSISTYVQDLLGLPRNCRLFEIKQACYSATAGLQMAANFVLSGASPGAKALVIATDISRFALADDRAIQEWAYSEPTSGAGAVAMLVGDAPTLLRLDPGAYGNHSFEVMDTCRPGPDTEAGDADLSLMAYLECCEGSWRDYARRVEGADLRATFGQLCFHTPFGGMVKGAHRHLMRRCAKATPAEIEADFTSRVAPGLGYGQRVGNIAGGSLYLSLASCIAAGADGQRLGLFSYGSGCCSEFFSGVAPPGAGARLEALGIGARLDQRRRLSMDEYEALLRGGKALRFGVRDVVPDPDLSALAAAAASPRLVLQEIVGYHRKYRWV